VNPLASHVGVHYKYVDNLISVVIRHTDQMDKQTYGTMDLYETFQKKICGEG